LPEDQPDLFDRLLELLAALIMPVWGDLIVLIPIVLIVIMIVFLVWLVWLWRSAAPVNQPRVIPRFSGTPPPGIHLPGPSWWPFLAPIGIALALFGIIFNPTLIVVGVVIGLIPLVGWLRDANREWRNTELAAGSAGSHGQLMAAIPAALPSGTWRAGPVAALPALASPGPSAAAVVVQPPPGVHMPGPSPWPFFAPIGIALAFYGLIFNPILIVGGVALGAIAAIGWLRDANREWRSTDVVGHAVPTYLDPVQAWPRRLLPLFAVVIAVSVLLAVLPALGGWLATLRPADATPTPLLVPAIPEIAASSATSFETTLLITPAGRPFELVFHNRDAGVPHNVMIANGPDRATVYLDGEVIDGPADITYQVPSLDPGDYYFLCRVHPNMNGSLKAMPETGPGGGPSGSPAQSGGASPSP
jgi:hypothetical protein